MQIHVDADSCIGCRLCELGCSYAKDKEYRPSLSRIRLANAVRQGVSVPLLCRQCTECGPMEICPEGAITRHSESGAILVDPETCTACGRCSPECSYGALTFHPDTQKLQVCDLCGGDPACVKYCFTNAIAVSDEWLAPAEADGLSDYVSAIRAKVLQLRDTASAYERHRLGV